MSDQPTPTAGQAPPLMAVPSSVLLGCIYAVPISLVVCPECGGQLQAQTSSTDLDDGLMVDCENDPDDEWPRESNHRYWQGEWEPVIAKVKWWMSTRQPNR